jgi:hypothetical protein
LVDGFDYLPAPWTWAGDVWTLIKMAATHVDLNNGRIREHKKIIKFSGKFLALTMEKGFHIPLLSVLWFTRPHPS